MADISQARPPSSNPPSARSLGPLCISFPPPPPQPLCLAISKWRHLSFSSCRASLLPCYRTIRHSFIRSFSIRSLCPPSLFFPSHASHFPLLLDFSLVAFRRPPPPPFALDAEGSIAPDPARVVRRAPTLPRAPPQFYDESLEQEQLRAKVQQEERDIDGPTRQARRAYEKAKIANDIEAQKRHLEHVKYEEALEMLAQRQISAIDIAKYYNDQLEQEQLRSKVQQEERDIDGPTRQARREYEKAKIANDVEAQKRHLEHIKYEEALEMLAKNDVSPIKLAKYYSDELDKQIDRAQALEAAGKTES
ncbi:hypothetical protein AB1Y20_013463 [Prymnesium parvum]|uniref:Uncharacterized protein n=1 Tax=Prymnesium parvum TaxID=97485 RepID=A0AB34IIB7_PRYPA